MGEASVETALPLLRRVPMYSMIPPSPHRLVRPLIPLLKVSEDERDGPAGDGDRDGGIALPGACVGAPRGCGRPRSRETVMLDQLAPAAVERFLPVEIELLCDQRRPICTETESGRSSGREALPYRGLIVERHVARRPPGSLNLPASRTGLFGIRPPRTGTVP